MRGVRRAAVRRAVRAQARLHGAQKVPGGFGSPGAGRLVNGRLPEKFRGDADRQVLAGCRRMADTLIRQKTTLTGHQRIT